MNTRLCTFTLALSFLLCSCSHTLRSESGLYDVELNRTYKVPVDGFWLWGKGNRYASQKGGYIYVAPLDTSAVQAKEPELAALLVHQMYEYMMLQLSSALADSNAANQTAWKLTPNPAEATVRFDMAVVHLRPQRPGLRLLSSIGGLFSPVPGVSDVAGHFAEGDICIECTARDARTGELMMAFKDSNRKKARLYTAEAYSRGGAADINMQHWAKKLGQLVRESANDRLQGHTLEEKINNRSVSGAIRARLD